MPDPSRNDSSTSRAIWLGLAFWTGVCLLAVLLRGVRWEEGYERAQVLLGFTPYPEGHPHARWYWNAFSIHYYASAALLWITRSDVIVCGTRQFIATLAIALPIFSLTWLLGRRALPAHLAVLLSFAGATSVFQSYMPISAWANKATSGQIGIGWAFVVLIMLCAGRWRLAGILCGLMPLIHIGQWPVVMLTVLVTGAWHGWRGDGAAPRQLARYLAIGLGGCALFALARHPFLIPDPVEGAYYAANDGRAIWADYVTHEDMHRAITHSPRFGPVGNSLMALGGFLILALPLALREWRAGEKPSPWLVLFSYGLLCALAFGAAQGIHRILGTEVPGFVVIWMPNRLTIHLALLLLCGVCVWPRGRSGILVTLISLAWLAALPIWPMILSADLAQRYFSGPETALFFMAGGSIVSLWSNSQHTGPLTVSWRCLVVVGWVALAMYHQFAAASVLVGIAVALAGAPLASRNFGPRTRTLGSVVACFMGITALAHILLVEWRMREQLPISPFEAEMARYLAEHSVPSDMVLTPLEEHYQMVLQRPVVATFETRQHSGYVPSIAATNSKLFADLYGVKDGHWYDWDLWQRRTEKEWEALGQAYGFRYVISKDFYPLHLPVCLHGEGLVLYEVPRSTAAPNS